MMAERRSFLDAPLPPGLDGRCGRGQPAAAAATAAWWRPEVTHQAPRPALLDALRCVTKRLRHQESPELAPYPALQVTRQAPRPELLHASERAMEPRQASLRPAPRLAPWKAPQLAPRLPRQRTPAQRLAPHRPGQASLRQLVQQMMRQLLRRGQLSA